MLIAVQIPINVQLPISYFQLSLVMIQGYLIMPVEVRLPGCMVTQLYMNVKWDTTIHLEIWKEHVRLMVHGMALCLHALVGS